MGYAAGVDLGTTFTAAAISSDGQAEMVTLGASASAIPSVLLLRDDGTFANGESAVQRGQSSPDRLARGFKRRMGDPAPILLGSAPFSAHQLMGHLLESVMTAVTERQGGVPDGVVVTHPANWGGYKREYIRQAIRMAGLDHVTTITEPEAAAIHYANQKRVETGSLVGVYDLGGGTFDAAVLQKTPDGFAILGEPEGIEQLGGLDFDQALLEFVLSTASIDRAQLDQTDPSVGLALSRLRSECVSAKIALSSETDVVVPLLFRDVDSEVRVTRSEFEVMISPAIAESMRCLRRAITSAGVEPDVLDAVLLVGGSSRIPLVGQRIGAELGRPVAVDADPKNAIALGAARHAFRAPPSSSPPPPPSPPSRLYPPPTPAYPPPSPPSRSYPPPSSPPSPSYPPPSPPSRSYPPPSSPPSPSYPPPSPPSYPPPGH